ncbi:hypothetical protein EVAR_39651_1 [Eumeta japonica]|uniref:Uncharacterized protein n=1 Tax=Eumeta variegata TaxID=151549 RepID=A0A4C1WHS1_EUMVA|nr:hypothetical protein EVAR_39651_1 [Eumeta japonica]
MPQSLYRITGKRVKHAYILQLPLLTFYVNASVSLPSNCNDQSPRDSLPSAPRTVQRTKLCRSELATNDKAQVLRSPTLLSSPPHSCFTPLGYFVTNFTPASFVRCTHVRDAPRRRRH